MVVAAGSGARLGASEPKAFVPLAGVPILGHALRGVLASSAVDEVVLVVPDSHLAQAQAIADEVCRAADSRVPVTLVSGGAERGDSVLAGLHRLSAAIEVVLVHDAARCLTPVDLFERVVAAVDGGAVAAVPGTPVVDTVKQVDAHGVVVSTPDRATLRAIQTPQGFRRDVLERAHAALGRRVPASGGVTDDAGLVERLGEPVVVVAGDPLAMKVTTPGDLDAASRLLG
ncbi:2-C-methyl-D-erythritol 4-phosphate cytidylyltransferase [Intrasporangium mesophilum]